MSAGNTASVNFDANNSNKKVICKNCAPFTDCIRKIHNAQVDNAKNVDVMAPMYNLLQYSAGYSETSVSLFSYYRDHSALHNNATIVYFPNDTTTDPFKSKVKITGHTGNNFTKSVEIMVLLK